MAISIKVQIFAIQRLIYETHIVHRFFNHGDIQFCLFGSKPSAL
ncbi:hypothetical protein VCR3J2_310285 [Vibrio coralliirubri]|nr:hypothetical protein VCR26J2_290079 [Vibrio coralliirubri]CDT87063.1 hypothetical protein VCR3J2_310285 [Vibrio coralliirubri]